MCRNFDRAPHSEVDFDQLCRFLEMVNPVKTESIQFSGGNVNMYSKYRELCIFCGKSFKSAMLILTSNMRSPEKDLACINYIRENVQNKLYLSLPVDGTPEIHNKVRGLDNSFGNLLQMIAELSRGGVALGSSLTITKENTKTLDWVYSFSRDNDLDFWANPQNSGYFYNTPYIPMKKRNPDLEVVTSLESILDREVNELNLGVSELKFQYFSRLIDYYKGEDIPRVKQCGAGGDHIVISDSGDIYPCIFLNHKIGDISSGLANTIPPTNCNCLTVCHSQEYVR